MFHLPGHLLHRLQQLHPDALGVVEAEGQQTQDNEEQHHHVAAHLLEKAQLVLAGVEVQLPGQQLRLVQRVAGAEVLHRVAHALLPQETGAVEDVARGVGEEKAVVLQVLHRDGAQQRVGGQQRHHHPALLGQRPVEEDLSLDGNHVPCPEDVALLRAFQSKGLDGLVLLERDAAALDGDNRILVGLHRHQVVGALVDAHQAVHIVEERHGGVLPFRLLLAAQQVQVRVVVHQLGEKRRGLANLTLDLTAVDLGVVLKFDLLLAHSPVVGSQDEHHHHRGDQAKQDAHHQIEGMQKGFFFHGAS